MLSFEWDKNKARKNLTNHDVSFDEASTVNMKRMQKDKDMLEEYDFSKGIQGKYAKRYAEGTNVIVIEPDVAKFFPVHDSVNQV